MMGRHKESQPTPAFVHRKRWAVMRLHTANPGPNYVDNTADIPAKTVQVWEDYQCASEPYFTFDNIAVSTTIVGYTLQLPTHIVYGEFVTPLHVSAGGVLTITYSRLL